MGNLFSKKSRVAPLPNGQNLPRKESTKVRSTHWYRNVFCCGKDAATVLNGNIHDSVKQNTVRKLGGSPSDVSFSGKDYSLELQGFDDDDDGSVATLDTFEVRQPMKLQLPADKAPLPKIDDGCNSELLRSGLSVVKDYSGKTRAVAYDVEFLDDSIPNRPASSISMGNPACLPRRLREKLPALPAISQDIIHRK